jgi:hypothetical protein
MVGRGCYRYFHSDLGMCQNVRAWQSLP